MATVHVAIGYSKGRGVSGANLPVKSSLVSRSIAVTSTGTSALVALTATQAEINEGALWFITVSGGAVDVTAGDNPTAVSTNSHRLLDGGRLELAINAVGEKLAIKDAA